MLTLFTILVVILGIIISANMKNHRMTTLLVVLLSVLVVCYVRYMLHKHEGFSSNYYFAPLEYTMSGGCSGMQSPSNNLVYPSMGPMAWDGLVLKSTPKEEKPLLSDVTIFSPVGDAIELSQPLDSANFPTVDGKNGPKDLFMLAYNQVSTDCCPSTFSDSRGCVCLTTEQTQNMINKRWGNRSTDLYPNI